MSESRAPRPKPTVLPAAPTSTAPLETEEAAPAPTVAALPPVLPRPPQSGVDEMIALYRGAVEAIGVSQRAFASGISALALEMTGLAHAGFTEAADSAAALLGARDVDAVVEIQIGFARRSLDAMVAGSGRLRAIGAHLASEATRPIVAPLTKAARIG